MLHTLVKYYNILRPAHLFYYFDTFLALTVKYVQDKKMKLLMNVIIS